MCIIYLFIFARPDLIPEAVSYEYNLFKVLPYVFVLVMALIGVNVFVVLSSGILLSGVIGFIYGDFTLLSYGKEIYNGFTNMTEIFILSLLTGGISKKISENNKIDLRESAAFLDIFSCVFQGMIPYGAQMLILLGFASDKVSPMQLIPLLWYQLLLGLFTLIYIFVPQISNKTLSFIDKK